MMLPAVSPRDDRRVQVAVLASAVINDNNICKSVVWYRMAEAKSCIITSYFLDGQLKLYSSKISINAIREERHDAE